VPASRLSNETDRIVKKNPKQLLTRLEISLGLGMRQIQVHVPEKLMNAPTSSGTAEKSLPVGSDVEAEISQLVEKNILKRPPQIETEVERIRSSLARVNFKFD
jgi:hypothetical protein